MLLLVFGVDVHVCVLYLVEKRQEMCVWEWTLQSKEHNETREKKKL